jgi:hypothetical protein
MDRVYAMNLAMIRKAAQMTQVEVARKLGVGQGAAPRLERRDDMLLSTSHGRGQIGYGNGPLRAVRVERFVEQRSG